MSEVDGAVENSIGTDSMCCGEFHQPDNGLSGRAEFAPGYRADAGMQDGVVKPVLKNAEQRYRNGHNQQQMYEPVLVRVVPHRKKSGVQIKNQGDSGRNAEQIERVAGIEETKIHRHEVVEQKRNQNVSDRDDPELASGSLAVCNPDGVSECRREKRQTKKTGVDDDLPQSDLLQIT